MDFTLNEEQQAVADLARQIFEDRVDHQSLKQVEAGSEWFDRETWATIKRAVNTAVSIRHPFEEDLGFLYGTILTGPAEDPAHHSRNICVFANAEVDRSPTGTGVSARLALHHAKGELAAGETIVIESILGRHSTFSGRIVDIGQVDAYEAVVPEVGGTAFITGRHEFVVDRRDRVGQGFLL